MGAAEWKPPFGPRRAWNDLVARVRVAKLVLLLDADSCTRALLAAAGRDDLLWVEAPGDPDREWVVWDKRNDLVRQVIAWADAGERVAVHARSVKWAKTLGRRLQKAIPDKNVVVLHPDSVGDFDLSNLSWMREVAR